MSGKTPVLRAMGTGGGGSGGGAPSGAAGGDLGSTYPNPTVVATHLSAALPVAQGGTGKATITSGALQKGAGTSALADADLTGDVTTSGGVATTIANGAVTLAKMANLAANSLLGNNTGSAATPIALTAAQVLAWLSTKATSGFDWGGQKLSNFRYKRRDGGALTDGATITFAADSYETAHVTLGGNRTLAFSGTADEGDVAYLEVTEDGTGGRTLTCDNSTVILSNDLGGTNGTVGTIPLDTTLSRRTGVLAKFSAQANKWVVHSVSRF